MTRPTESIFTSQFLAGMLLSIFACTASAQIADPVPEPIQPGALSLRIVDWIQVPNSGINNLPARINLAMSSGDGSGRVFVNDQRGLLHVINGNSISLYLDLNDEIPAALQISSYGNGFHAFAFHPQFAGNGKFYTVHMEDPVSGLADLLQLESGGVNVHSVITEWTATSPAVNFFTGSHREVLRIEQPNFAHTIQQVAFNPNATIPDADFGKLYIGQGDGAVWVTDRPQSLDIPHGSLLRIDPLGNDSGNGQYGIPADNPFAGDGDPGTLDEIWAWGFRNPHRMSWDTSGDQKMLIGDIGQTNIEEINLGEAGQNYGWNYREGTFLLDTLTIDDVFPLPANDALLGYRYPVAQYDHDEGNAVVSGFVYRGGLIPELDGQFLFGDIVNGRIFYVDIDYLVDGRQAVIKELNLVDTIDQTTNLLSLVDDTRADLRFGIDGSSELLILTKTDGMIRRLESLGPADSDGDGVADPVDNCQQVINTSQLDTDLDGFGNACDADTNNDCIINFLDVGEFSNAFLSSNLVFDFNDDGQVNFLDYPTMTDAIFQAPGPSSLADCGS